MLEYIKRLVSHKTASETERIPQLANDPVRVIRRLDAARTKLNTLIKQLRTLEIEHQVIDRKRVTLRAQIELAEREANEQAIEIAVSSLFGLQTEHDRSHRTLDVTRRTFERFSVICNGLQCQLDRYQSTQSDSTQKSLPR